MTDTDIYQLFMQALDVTNLSLRENRDSTIFGTILSAWDQYVDGHKAGVAVYDEDPDQPFDYFTVRYANQKLELQSRGKSEHDTEWKVSRKYLQSLVDEPQKYIDNPAMLDIDWLRSRLPDGAASMLRRLAGTNKLAGHAGTNE